MDLGGGVWLGGWGGSLEHPKLKHLLNWLLQRKKKLLKNLNECGMNANVVLLIVYFLMLLQSIA